MNYYRIFSPSNCVISLMVWWKWHLSPIAPFFFLLVQMHSRCPSVFFTEKTEEERNGGEKGELGIRKVSDGWDWSVWGSLLQSNPVRREFRDGKKRVIKKQQREKLPDTRCTSVRVTSCHFLTAYQISVSHKILSKSHSIRYDAKSSRVCSTCIFHTVGG